MGNRALTRAVAALMTEKPALRSRLREIILAAPDIDADVFKRDIAPALAATGAPVTLYASSTGIDSSLLGHSYFADTRSVIEDLVELIDTGHRADYRREPRGIADASGRHGVFKP